MYLKTLSLLAMKISKFLNPWWQNRCKQEIKHRKQLIEHKLSFQVSAYSFQVCIVIKIISYELKLNRIIINYAFTPSISKLT